MAKNPYPASGKIYSWQHGRKLNSWTEYNNANKELGLVDAGDYKPQVEITKFPDTGKVSRVVPDE